MEKQDLPPWYLDLIDRGSSGSMDGQSVEIPLFENFYRTMEAAERAYIERALIQNSWRVNRTALAIGMSKGTMIRKMKEYGFKSDKPNFKPKKAKKSENEQSSEA